MVTEKLNSGKVVGAMEKPDAGAESRDASYNADYVAPSDSA